jgi:hypothetical protein
MAYLAVIYNIQLIVLLDSVAYAAFLWARCEHTVDVGKSTRLNQEKFDDG